MRFGIKKTIKIVIGILVLGFALFLYSREFKHTSFVAVILAIAIFFNVFFPEKKQENI